MTHSKHRPPEQNGSQPDDTREPDREVGVSGLPKAKLQYITGGYGFGMRQRDREDADG